MADRATCLELSYLDETEILTLEHDVARGSVTFDPAKAPACIEAYQNLPCGSSDFLPSVRLTAASACSAIFTGHAPEGAPCFQIEECTPGLYCRDPGSGSGSGACIDACCPGSTCAPLAGTVAEGASCKKGTPLTPSQLCAAANQYCATGKEFGTDGTCQAQVAGEGAACVDYDSCEFPRICVYEGGAGHCRHPIGEGDTCMSASGAVTPCDLARDFCDPTTRTCVRLHHVGEACTTSGRECEKAAYCDATTSTCQARASRGAVCGGAAAVPCRDAFVCDAASAHCTDRPAGRVCE